MSTTGRSTTALSPAGMRTAGTRCLAVVAPYFPPKIGGVEAYAATLARSVAARPDWRVVVITTRTDPGQPEVTDQAGMRVHRLPVACRISNSPLHPRWPGLVRRILDDEAVDVLSVHAPVPGLPDVAVLVAGARPVVLTYHCGTLAKGRPVVDAAIRGYERTVLPRLFARAAHVISASPSALPYRLGYPQVITPGVDTDRFVPGPPDGPDGPNGPGRPDAASVTPTVLYVGRLDRSSAWKGVDVLIGAVARLADDLPALRLRIVGPGDARPDLESLAARRGIADRVTFTGPLDGAALVREYQRCWLLALPSRSEAESFGMTLVEAMACGRPVVGSAIGGIPHVIDHDITGLLVPPGDEDALAQAIAAVVGDPARRGRLGTAGRTAAEQRFSWAARLAAYHRLFDAAVPATGDKDD